MRVGGSGRADPVGSAAGSKQPPPSHARSACAARAAPVSNCFFSRRCINIQMPLRITHCRARCEGPSPLLQPRHRARAQPRPLRGQPRPPRSFPARGQPPRARAPFHFADGSSPVDAQVIELTMAKTFVASMARGLGALLLITLALETQANRARPASPVSFRGSSSRPAQARSSRRRTGASTSSPPASAPSSRLMGLVPTTWPTASRRPSARRPSRPAGRGHRVGLRVLWGLARARTSPRPSAVRG